MKPVTKRYRPKSLLQLTLIGFVLVVLPLIAGLVMAVVRVDDLARQSEQAVIGAARAMQASRQLVEQLTAMERNARQARVLEDERLWQLYLERRADFRKVLIDLEALAPAQARLLRELGGKERHQFDALQGGDGSQAEEIEQALDEFPDLARMARENLTKSGEAIRREAENMRSRSARAAQVLVWQAIALVPLALGLGALFTILITRPLRQIRRAIRGLGSGSFTTPITVQGPQDLEELGRQLDWLRTRLAELEEQKIMVLRHISHELKTPLTAIREGAELLNDGVVGRLSPEQNEVAQILKDNSVQLQKRIEDLLSFSVARTPPTKIHPRPIPLHLLVEDALTHQRLAMKSKGLTAARHMAAVTVAGEREQLQVVVDNLLSNAIKYSPSGGTLDIDLARDARNGVLDVRDQGAGIAPEDRGRVLEAFYQGRAGYDGHVKGTGLGLAIAKQFVQLHGGSIEVLPAARGAHLRVTLPLADEAAR